MRSLLGGIADVLNRAPVPYSSGRQSFSLPMLGKSNQEAQMAAMGSVGTLFAIVNRTSNATSQVQWHLYRKAESGMDEDREEVTKHLALQIWNRPNSFMPGQEFRETFQQHVDLVGEGWWLIERDPRSTLPLGLWPVRPDRMEPIPSPTEFLTGYVYHGPNGEDVPLGRDEVIFLRMPNPLDMYRGMGPVQSIMVDLDSTKYSAEWNRSFFRNSAEPGGIVEVEKRLGDEEFNELRDRWNEQHRGVSKAHRVAILEQGKWVDRKYTMRDMQFTELRNVAREIIREAFGMHGHLIGLSADINRANAEAAELVFAKWQTVPRLERIKNALNFEFLPLFGKGGEGVEFDYDSPVDEDEETSTRILNTKALAASRLVQIGFVPADVLEAVGLPEMEFEKKEPPPQFAPGKNPNEPDLIPEPDQDDPEDPNDPKEGVENA